MPSSASRLIIRPLRCDTNTAGMKGSGWRGSCRRGGARAGVKGQHMRHSRPAAASDPGSSARGAWDAVAATAAVGPRSGAAVN